MKRKQFIKMIFSRYGSLGLSLMGIYNIWLLLKYFTHRIDAMPVNLQLLVTDVLLIFFSLLAGLAVETILLFYRKMRRRPKSPGEK